ncbi:MAG: rod-capping linker protein [Merismopedia sp. SIO2A8]|nr:rod-capping linker protein [Symploca sp. SIO2B6]NET53380.1 rod-capping linker protein [Merismopedia sp. SIO2A8]
MSGMATTGTSALSDYNSRSIVIEVTGLCRQDVMRTSNYTVKVPYSRMSQAMQGIMRMGGKVVGVKMASEAPPSEGQSSEGQ